MTLPFRAEAGTIADGNRALRRKSGGGKEEAMCLTQAYSRACINLRIEAAYLESPDAAYLESPDAAYLESPDAAYLESPDAAYLESPDAAYLESPDAAYLESPDAPNLYTMRT
ncbi:hypothetical protein GUITHDRAFT_112611 [Guillardia theta CCMP2712]|uniref:Uncharacterized protein n=1 Tax=Guillardia theta (strain CCMP2712) TaxID=905079 RepID=L1IZ97_GUITC|nr:hypothetical protein GUITHDRAFT_112611 [Guillardia theta CCMP2712]EKX41397.1 hypothetical protein GUITHDRAFT_112611 [Guillardia theta CCMP2712]|eukprot:XP_005828377.1 hypothetical protein GUITHDRAFT_112611 [Guillardia theta CCMP2712]